MRHLDDPQREALAQGAAGVDAEAAAHHVACAECQVAVRDAKARRALLGGLTPYTLSDMAFRRVEARLMEAVEHDLEGGLLSRAPWLRWLVPVGLAAAAALVTVTLLPARTAGPHVVPLPAPAPALAAAPFQPLSVLRAAPDSQARSGEGAWRALGAGDVLAQGDAVSTAGVLLAPADAPGQPASWAFEASGSLALGGAATVTLGAGTLAAQVGQAVAVAAGTRQVHAVEARFVVSRSAAEVVLTVAEGEVDVVDSLSAERRRVTAPATLRFADGAPLSQGRAEAPGSVPALAVPPRPWVRFDASGLPAGTQVSLDGAGLGAAPLVALVGAGRHQLGLALPGQPMTQSWVELVGDVPFVATLPEPADGPAPDAAALERVQRELLRHRPKLAACYEKWLKANPTASGTAELALTVTAAGRVKAARVRGGGLPKASADCLVRTAKGLSLPALGVDAELEVPLVFTAGAR